ncbi:MAG: cytochrome c oxidase subunit II [Acidimicrobiales bacterium]|nr:cytochrome c oxidase subunit II [Acidimicrobiales bacterium]
MKARADGRDPAPSDRPTRRSRLLVGGVLGLLAVVLSACNLPTFESFPSITKQSRETAQIWFGSVCAALAVGILVWLLIAWAVVRYRAKGKGEGEALPKQTRYNHKWEVVYTTVPVLIVLALFGFTVLAENQADATGANAAARIEVTAYRWGWNFHYVGTNVTITPTGVPTASGRPGAPTDSQFPQMVLPENQLTQLRLVSDDVVHGFYVPAFLFSRYAQPGVVNRFSFTPTKLGVYDGRCTQYCGLYHAEMLFSVRVVTPSQFRSWLSSEESRAKVAT